jgi:hypothetical protein
VNFFNFMITRQLVVNKTGDTSRANQLGMLTSFIPGTWGMMMGMLLADREEAAKPRAGGANGEPGKEPGKDAPKDSTKALSPGSPGPTAR